MGGAKEKAMGKSIEYRCGALPGARPGHRGPAMPWPQENLLAFLGTHAETPGEGSL